MSTESNAVSVDSFLQDRLYRYSIGNSDSTHELIFCHKMVHLGELNAFDPIRLGCKIIICI